MYQLTPLPNQPILHVADFPELEGNINGPSLIHVPDWVTARYGRYYLYFAHHEGKTIRLAYADTLTGPWTLHPPGALALADSLFPTEAPADEDLHLDARELMRLGHDGNYPHIASPDVVIDDATQTIRLYYHGRIADGRQCSRVALSKDGVNFTAREPLLGKSYMRVFQHENDWYGIAMPGILYRSANGLDQFETAHHLFAAHSIRHMGLLKEGDLLTIFFTVVGDAPEHIKVTTVDLKRPFPQWQITPPISVHKPTHAWEGTNYPITPSVYGGTFDPVNQLRDPAVFEEDGKVHLLYAIAGEQGIAIGELHQIG